ncbi:MAG TPA: ribosome-binding factor A, partial [Opitutaceae bacterium]|nr:ribosome-binding factor A [Opitutaceae bacterium]
EAVALTVTEVRVSPDMRDGRVFVAVVGSEDFAADRLRWLRRKAREIREELGRRIVLKFLPRLEYRLDESSVRSARLITLLDQLDAKDKE